jgi:hypothetical protein
MTRGSNLTWSAPKASVVKLDVLCCSIDLIGWFHWLADVIRLDQAAGKRTTFYDQNV